MKWLFTLLLAVLSACGPTVEPYESESQNYELPAPYIQTLLATQHEWVAAGMPFPDECITMATRMVLYFDEWDELARVCQATPGSSPPDWDAGIDLELDFRVSACILSGDTYRVHFDNGETEGRKHAYFVHEVLHALQHCSQRGTDYTHLDTYVWDTILPRARAQVVCGDRPRFGEKELEEVYCFTP